MELEINKNPDLSESKLNTLFKILECWKNNKDVNFKEMADGNGELFLENIKKTSLTNSTTLKKDVRTCISDCNKSPVKNLEAYAIQSKIVNSCDSSSVSNGKFLAQYNYLSLIFYLLIIFFKNNNRMLNNFFFQILYILFIFLEINKQKIVTPKSCHLDLIGLPL